MRCNVPGAMRKGIHPLQRCLTIVNTKGASSVVWSTMRAPNDTYFLQSDTTTHAAWTGRKKQTANTGRVAMFRQRFGLGASKEAPPASAAPATVEKTR